MADLRGGKRTSRFCAVPNSAHSLALHDPGRLRVSFETRQGRFAPDQSVPAAMFFNPAVRRAPMAMTEFLAIGTGILTAWGGQRRSRS